MLLAATSPFSSAKHEKHACVFFGSINYKQINLDAAYARPNFQFYHCNVSDISSSSAESTNPLAHRFKQ